MSKGKVLVMGSNATRIGPGSRTDSDHQGGVKAKPSHFMVTTKDKLIPPTFQRAFAKRAKTTITEIAVIR
ncbi:hypothetical protein FHX06_006381 [Rhizobium sp. BK512]|uniref:hypothetical protein n=1 Tax=Rhizobium sp. BK512 TaxID=2587010 RepID=UPI000DDEF239|nr:hypothetical protein [Rhizobium sp. BK512]MBB3565011.1 hypothetical protein [Rhizobium sp. BK512]